MERQLNRHRKRRKFVHGEQCCCFQCITFGEKYKKFNLSILLTVFLSISSAFTLLTTTVSTATALTHQIVVIEPANSNNNSTKFNLAINVQHQLVQASFSTPNRAINITHVTYDPLHDTVYLGATNTIYQLNGSDLSAQHEQFTGPINDNPSCGVNECHGFEEYMKPIQNVNKVLVIDYQHKKLLSCGSTKQGACRRYQLNNISQKEDLIPMAVAANDDNSSTYAFIAPARYTYDPSTSGGVSFSSSANSVPQTQQQVLYVASTYTKVGQSRDLMVPAIGTRTLDDGPNLLKLYENSFLDSARIDINSHLRDYFLVNYLYGFASSNYVYFVTVQKKATSRDYEELGYHTRLARICITDSSYNSYTEIDLKCSPNKKKAQPKYSSFLGSSANQQATPSEYPLLQDAILVDAGSQLLQSLMQNDQSSQTPTDLFNNPSSGSTTSDDSKVLLGVFSSAKDHTQYAGDHSALCAFSLAQIEEKFNDNIHNCYTGKMQSRNMEYIAGNVQECPKTGQGGNVVNFCHETLKINGTIPIISEASVEYFNTTLTAITATSQINSNVKNIYSDSLANDLYSYNSSISSSIPTLSNFAQQQQQTVVFMGTSSGHLKKVLLNNATNGIEFEDVQLDTNPILSDLHLHSSGQQLIVSTPYKVMKVPAYNCGQHLSCRECSQSKSPYCGWCSLKRSCTTRNECVSVSSGDQPNAAVATPQVRNVAFQGGESSASKQLKWISYDSAGKCIDLQSIVPDKIPITGTGKIDLYIDRLPRLPKEHSYKCIFDKKEQTTASLISSGLSCPLPKVMHRPKIQPGRDHVVVDLAVKSSETNIDFLNGQITFFDCQLHTTCKDCLNTNWGCNWCLNENICLFNSSKCEKTGSAQGKQDVSSTPLLISGKWTGSGAPTTLAPVITISNAANERSSLSLTTVSSNGAFTSSLVQSGAQLRSSTGNIINQVNQCPSFDVGYKQEILIADGSERELAVKVRNMPQFKGNIQCIVEIEDNKVPLKARMEDDRVICENLTYSYAAEVGLLSGQLVVIYSDNNIFIDRTNFTMYKCQILGAYPNRPDCSLCQRIDSRFNCVWCSGACNHRSHCIERPADRCPVPRIDYVHPFIGSVQGATKVTFEGSNLGQSFEDIISRGVSVGGVPFRPIEDDFKPSIANSTERLSYMSDTYTHYVPRENENIFGKLSGYVTSALIFILYLVLGVLILGLIYSSLTVGYGLRKRTSYKHEYDNIRSKIDLLEKSIRNECRVASVTLKNELDDLVRHIDISGVPLLNAKHYIMNVFFPGINNHPLLVKSVPNVVDIESSNSMSNITGQQNPSNFMTLQHHPRVGSDFPMEYFERLILTKPFLITFINTLEAQPGFTIRDRVNVASLIMIILMERLDYATDIMRTLIFHLVEKSVNKNHQGSRNAAESNLLTKSLSKSISRKASNLFGGLTTSSDERTSRTAALGKAVGGSASSLMANTTVAAQMLLPRVGNKTSPLQPNHNYLNQTNLIGTNTLTHDMNTTTFNQRNAIFNSLGSINLQKNRKAMNSQNGKIPGSHLMLRQTESVVEKMLTNWLALTMYDYFQGDVGQSLYMMFEALKYQLDQGPVESFSGDAYYSLNEQKLLRDPYIQYETLSVYVIVETDLFQLTTRNNPPLNSQNLLLDTTSHTLYRQTGTQPFCNEDILSLNRSPNYAASNAITLSVRVLDCDTISQVKGKILSALYRNLPYSTRLKPDAVALSLRQPFHNVQTGISDSQFVNVTLHDDDFSSTVSYNGLKRINTMKHYGVSNRAILALTRVRQASHPRVCQSITRTTLTDMLDEHYNNPYSEIQYGAGSNSNPHNVLKTSTTCSSKWHLVKPDQRFANSSLNSPSNESSPSSHSPSMMLLGNESSVRNAVSVPNKPNAPHLNNQHSQHQQYYHPSSSSTSSTGNVMDTNSTSANSSSMNVTNLLMRSRNEQPIYCQIESTTAPSRQGAVSSSYYCQIGKNNDQFNTETSIKSTFDQEQEQQILLKRMLISKETVQSYIDNFLKTILSYRTKQPNNQAQDDYLNSLFCNDVNGTRATSGSTGTCPIAVKWLFDLLDEAAIVNGVTDDSVIHSWKSNAFLLRFWVNIIKNPNYVLDVEKSTALDASLSVIAQTLMDACSPTDNKPTKESTCDKLLFAKDIPKYKGLVKRFYQDIASMRPVSNQEIIKQMSSLSISNTRRFDTNLALKELCVYAVNYGVELMGALNNDYTCQQLDLSQQLEQCFRSFTIFEAYR